MAKSRGHVVNDGLERPAFKEQSAQMNRGVPRPICEQVQPVSEFLCLGIE
jgi:hypothetical protein